MDRFVIAHIDSQKTGASEQALAIGVALGGDMPLETVTNAYEWETLPQGQKKATRISPLPAIEAVAAKYGRDAAPWVVTGDYGAGEAQLFKDVFPNAQILMSTYTVGVPSIYQAFAACTLDFLAVPRHAVHPSVLRGTPLSDILKGQEKRLVQTLGVPHMMTAQTLREKRQAWDRAAQEGKVKPLPAPAAGQKVVVIVMPGDVEDPNGRPRFFRESDATRLADAIWSREAAENAVFLVSNGPRTFKYSDTLCGAPAYEADPLAFKNPKNMEGLAHNPVAARFVQTLAKHAGADRVINGCIEKGVVPAQGFLAFYDLAKAQTLAGGKAALYMDGVSTTMLSQAVNLLSGVKVIACDTDAKNRTHIVGLEALYARGYIDHLFLYDGRYSYFENPQRPGKGFDDAKDVAAWILNKAAVKRGAENPAPRG